MRLVRILDEQVHISCMAGASRTIKSTHQLGQIASIYKQMPPVQHLGPLIMYLQRALLPNTD